MSVTRGAAGTSLRTPDGTSPPRGRWLALLLLAALGAGGCGESAPPRFAVARSGLPLVREPREVLAGAPSLLVDQVYEGLVALAPDSTSLEPGLATTWELSPDGRTWTLELRAGVRFHDGRPLDAGAVVTSLRRLLRASREQGSRLLAGVEAVEAPEEGRVRIRLARAGGARLAELAHPAAAVTGSGAPPPGTGPYRRPRREGGHWVLEANPDHWRGPARVAKLTLSREEPGAARLGRVLRGEHDLLLDPGEAELRVAASHPELMIERAAGAGLVFLAMGRSRPPLDDSRVRRAVAAAVDRRALAAGHFAGAGRAAGGFLPPSSPGHDPRSAPPGGDPTLAIALLRRAGYPQGIDLELGYPAGPDLPGWPTGCSDGPAGLASELARQLAVAGIRIELRGASPAALRTRRQAGGPGLTLGVLPGPGLEPEAFLRRLLGDPSASSGPTDAGLPEDAAGADRRRPDEVRDLLEELSLRFAPDARVALLRRLDRALAARVPVLPLIELDQRVVRRREAEGFRLHPSGRLLLAKPRRAKGRGEAGPSSRPSG